jgi:hypothetical protein
VLLRGSAIGTKASVGNADVYQHANGLPSHLARTAGDKRSSKEQRRRDLGAQASQGRGRPQGRASFTFARLFRPTRIPCPAGPLERCRSWGRRLSGLWGSALEVERRGSARSSLRRIELGPSLHEKEEGTGSVKNASCAATFAG